MMLSALTKDPLWLREWRASSRLVRMPWLISSLGAIVAGVMLLVALYASARLGPPVIGRNLFQLYFGSVALLVTFIGPILAANSIALEREGKTWEALVMAGVLPRAVDRGKFLGAYTQLALYLFALVPAAAIPHLFGGVTLLQTGLGLAMLFAMGALAVRVGLAMSSAFTSTRVVLLTSVVAACALCLGLTALGFGGGRWLERTVGMTTLDSYNDGPVFWPVALATERATFDYVRYLIVLPLGLGLAAWFSLRELTVAALLPDSRDARRGLRRLFVWLAPAVAVLLAFVPYGKFDDVFVTQVAYALFAFGAIVALGGDRLRGGTSAISSTMLLAGSAFGTLIVYGGALGLAAARGVIFTGDSDHASAMAFYAPCFLTFTVGAAAYLRSRITSTLLARAALVGVTLAGLTGPAIIGVVQSVSSGGSQNPASTMAFAFSPVSVLRSSYEGQPEHQLYAGAVWLVVGLSLILLAVRRERRSAS